LKVESGGKVKGKLKIERGKLKVGGKEKRGCLIIGTDGLL
jgi:hypothetical protein